MRKAALVGCGDVSIVHFEALRALGIPIVGVCDTDQAAAEKAAAHTGAQAFTSLERMLEETKPDVLHVTTPHDQHIDTTIKALDMGVNIILEKPIAHEIDEAERLVNRMEQPGTPKAGVCYQNRYNVSSQQLRRLLDSGALGNVNGAYSSVVWSRTPDYYRARPWRGQWERSGGGLLINQAIHTLDLIQWFLGDVSLVRGHVACDKYHTVSHVEDTAQMLFTHETGCQTAFYGTLTSPVHRPVELEIDCEKAYVRIRNGLNVTWKDGHTERWEERAAPSSGRSYWGVSHQLLIGDFYNRLDDPEPFWISPAEAMKSLRMAKDTYDFARQKIPREGEGTTP